METERKDVYARVTNQIIAAIEAGAGDYRMPWHHGGGDQHSPRNLVSEMHYRGINVLNLWLAAEEKGYTSGVWATYRQWKEHGAQVRRGEKSSIIVYWQQAKARDDEEDEGRAVSAPAFFFASYSVFNAAQVDGFTVPSAVTSSTVSPIECAEMFFATIPAVVQRAGKEAYYDSVADCVHVPDFDRFESAEAFYSVLAHELTHWSGAPQRLNRELSHRFGDEAYAMEELVAELGAAFACANLGIENEPRKDHAAYIASWLKVLKNDNPAVFTAASKAQLANDFFDRCYLAKAA